MATLYVCTTCKREGADPEAERDGAKLLAALAHETVPEGVTITPPSNASPPAQTAARSRSRTLANGPMSMAGWTPRSTPPKSWKGPQNTPPPPTASCRGAIALSFSANNLSPAFRPF